MSGRVGDLSPKQSKALEELKENVKDIWNESHDDYFMLKWLRARHFDVKKAEKMLRENHEWRIKFRADKLLEWEIPEVILKYRTGGAFGETKTGLPVAYDVYGYLDMKGIFYAARKQDLIRYKVAAVEYCHRIVFPDLSKKHGRRIDTLAYVFDMEHIGVKHLWKPAIDLFTELLFIGEANYPETLGKAYLINAPAIFPIAYNICKPFLSDDTKSKIHVLGSNWKEKLLEDIDPDQLPVHWGGTATGPDGNPYCTPPADSPFGTAGVYMGGKVSKEYMTRKDNFVDMTDFTTVTVGRGSSLQLDYEILEHNCAIRWQFQTEGNDIGFGLYRRTGDGRQKASEMEEIMRSERVNSHWVPEEGSHDCTQTGIYVVRFDNTYSWVSPKKLSYLIEVLKSDTKLMEEEIHMETTYL